MSFEDWSNKKKKKEEDGKSQQSSSSATDSDNGGAKKATSFTEWSNAKTGKGTSTIDPSIGAQGWRKYLEDTERVKASAEAEENDQAWWEKLLGYLGTTPDTSLPMGTTSQVVNDLRVDDSHRKPSDDWSWEQKHQFGALYLESPAKAYDYATKTNAENKKAKEEAEIKAIQDSATSSFGAGLGHTIAAVATAPMGLADYLADIAEANARGTITSDGMVSPFEYSQAVTSGIGTHLNEKGGTLSEDIPIIGGKGWGDVYSVGTSIAQSMASAYTLGGTGTLISYFGQGAAAGVDDALSRGATEEQAVLYGTALGAFEGIAEKIGVDNLFKLGSTGRKAVFKNLLNQAGAEGMEEGITSLLSNIADNAIMQDKSNFNAMVQAYMAQGMSEADAKTKAWLKSVEGVAFDTITGSISGGVHGGIHTGAHTVFANIDAKKTYGGQEKDLVGKAREIGTADTIGLADKYQSRLDKGKSLTGAQLRTLVETNERGIVSNDTTKIASAAEARLAELGETGDAKALAGILAKQVAGETLSRSEKALLEGSKYGKRVANELDPKKALSGEYTSSWVSDIVTERVNSLVYKLAREVAGATTEEDSASKPVAEKKYDVSESGKTTYGGKEVAIAEVADVKDGEVYLRLEGGETVKASDVEFATEDEALLYGLVATAGGSVDTAKELIGNFASANTNAKAYVGEALRAYQYGRVGIEKSLDNVELPEAVRKIAYNRGRIDAMTDAKQRPHHKTGEASTKRKINGIIYEGKGDSSLKKSPIQQGSIKAIETLAKLSPNIEFHVYRSEPKNGKRVAYIDGKIVENAPNGYFTEGNKIYIDLNAGNGGQGVMLYTASHEITHYIREWNAEGFKEFADFLFKHYGENDISIEKLITEQEKKTIARYKREGKAIPSAPKLFDMAYEEVVADAMSSMLADPKAYEKLAKLKKSNATLFEKIGEAIKKVLDKLKELLGIYKGYKVESQEAKYVSEFAAEVYEQLQDLYLKAFVQADANVEAFADGATDLDGGESPHLMSDRSMIEGAGLQFIINENGSGYKVLDSDGNPVKSVTAEMIVDSPLGNLVTMAKDEGFLGKGKEAETAATKQYEFLAELVNMCINYNGIAPIWETAGTMVFSSMKSNADKQYGLTIDFSTVCKKTQAIVDAMSEAMLRLGRGLNRSEVEAIYLEVGKAGESTPCPVCYVFSRWMGIGGILDQISQFQDKYATMSEKSLKAFVADIQQRITERANTPEKSGKLRAEFFGKGGVIAEGKVIAKLKEEANRKAASALNAIAKNSDTQLQIQELEALMENQREKEAKKTARKIATLKKKLQDVSALEKQMREGNDTLEEYEAYQWLTRTMLMESDGEWVKNPAFKPVPKDILFDLNKGDKFAEGYPLTWAFRTGKGASAGKAIVPYADARVGEAIQSVAAGSPKDIKIGLELNPFFNGNIKERKRILRSAIEKQARQNLLGGQRYQSTSDFRYEYGSDYLITFLEMQAIGAKVQLYTKVIEAVDFLASMGCDCNLSVMPLSDGFVTLPDGTKKLVYSSVTGIDAEAAIKKSREYNNVQLILVGISDEHIRLALEGTDVTFVIPFHGSGNSVHQIQALMNLLGENLDVTTAQDYTAVQSDHVSPTQTKEQKAMWDLRLKVIKGEAATLSSAEQALLDKNPFLKDLHRRFYLDTNAEEFGVWLTSAQSEQIFPYEYWDKSLTYAEADRNGERFKEYCATMGIIPRFSGKNSKGESVGYGDFTNDKGYWKLLIDRPMYDNTYDADGNWTGYGKYHEQARINCSNFQVKHLDPKYGSATYGDVMSKENDPKKTNKIVDAALKQFENNEVNDVRLHSDRDSEDSVREGEYTVQDIEGMFNRWNSDTELSALGEKVFAKLDSVIKAQKEKGDRERHYMFSYAERPYGIRFATSDYIKKHAFVDRGTGVFSDERNSSLYGITFDIDKFKGLETDQLRAQVLLHEAIHAVTVRTLNEVENLIPKGVWLGEYNAPDDWTEERKGALALLQIFTQVGFQGGKNHYGEKSSHEMVAELSNPEFRQYLKKQSLWSRVVDAIKRILGISTNALDASTKALYKILDGGSDSDIRYSLRDVDPVEPTTDKWQRTLTTSEVKKLFPNLWDVSADESEVRNPTQISGTVKSYRKVYDFLKKSGFKGTILDASSGLGYGTRAGIEEYGFDVEDIEPYPDKSYTPKYTDYSALAKQYDAIISNAVLNVLPQDQRDALVVKMGELLKVGGRMFINVRGDDVKSASSKVAINEDLMEYYISKSGSYQKGFTKSELVAYLQDALGDGFTVMPTTFFGKASAVVTKNAEQTMYSDRDTDAISSRTLLAEALESVAQNDIEKRKVAEYKAKIALIEQEQAKLSEIRAEIRELSFAKGPRDTERIKELQFDEKQRANSVNTYDRQLLRLQSTEALRGVMEREKKMAYEKAKREGKEALTAYREKTARTQRELLTKWQESRKRGIESRKMSAIREKIKAFKQRMEGTLQHPTDRAYIPVGLVSAMVDVCSLIDTDRPLYKADGSLNMAQARRDATKEKLQALKDEYEKLKTNADPLLSGEYEEVVYEYLRSLQTQFGSKSLYDMTLVELEDFYHVLKSIDETLREARKVIGWSEAKDVYDAGDVIVKEQKAVAESRKKGNRSVARDNIDNLSLSPVRNVERMTGYRADSPLLRLFNDFERGVRKKNMFAMESLAGFSALTAGENAKAYEDAIYKEFGAEYTDDHGRKFRVSKMQMMQAIMSYEREVANSMHHLAGSGFTFADLGLLRKGKLAQAISAEHSHRITRGVEMAQEFAEALKGDKWAQDYMAAARLFFDGKAKEAVNDTYVALKHRIIARDKSYIPFEVDKNFVVQEISAEEGIQQTINSYGMLKERKDGASQPLIITGLNNILERHIDQVGTVYGLAIPVRNFNKVWNVRAVDSGFGGDPTVKGAVETVWGKEGKAFIEQAVKDIQGNRPNTQSALYRRVKSNYIGAQFLLNGSVVLKQIGSLFSSTSMLRWRDPVRMVANLGYTMVHHKRIAAEVDKYTATAWMRRQGLSDGELHTLATEAKKGGVAKLFSKLPAVISPPKWIAGMDAMVALSLWKYAKEDTAKRTGLHGEELLKATAEFYDSVVENTQSMADVLHRPEIQKRSDVISEAFGMFKTDLYQMAGQLKVSFGRYQTSKTKANRAALARTVYSVMASAVWASLMTTAFALLRYKVNPYRDEEDDELTTWSWLKRQLTALFGDIVGYIFPIAGSDVVGALENIIYGESDDIVDSLALTAINDLYDAMLTIGASIKDGEMPSVDKMKQLAVKALQVCGVPANNIHRIVEAIRLHAEDIANGEFFSFEAGLGGPNAYRIYNAMLSGDKDRIEKASRHYESREDIYSAIRKVIREKYEDGDLSESEAKSQLTEYAGEDKDGAASKIRYWDFKIDYPDYDDLTESAVSKYYEYAEPYGISVEVYYDYTKLKAKCEGTDEDGDGETDRGSLKREVMRVIHSLPLTKRQKDALYYLNGWAESSIHEAPWR